MSQIWFFIALALSASATLLYLLGLKGPGGREARSSSTLVLVGQGQLLLAALVLTYFAFGRYDSRIWTDSAPLLLAVFVLWLVVFFTFVSRMKMVGLVASPLVTLLLFLQSFFYGSQQTYLGIDHPAGRYVAGFHVLSAALAQAFFALSAALAALYLWQSQNIRKKLMSSALLQGVSLDRLQGLCLRCLWIGTTLLTVALFLGSYYTGIYLRQMPQGLYPKIIWALVSWSWFMSILYSHYQQPQAMASTARKALGGFLFLALALFGMGFFRLS